MKPQNVGFTADKKLKLFDFGLAVCVKKNRTHDTTYKMTGNTGTLAYMAPEVALRKSYNEKVDVYSFAILLWQMLSGENPYPNLTRETYMQQVVVGGERLSVFPVMARAPIGVAKLIEQCWNADYTKRPDFTTILRDLTDFTTCNASPSNTEKAAVVVSSKKRTFLSLKHFFPPKNSEKSSSSASPVSGSTGSSSIGSGGSKKDVKGETAKMMQQTKLVLKPVSVSPISGEFTSSSSNLFHGSRGGSGGGGK